MTHETPFEARAELADPRACLAELRAIVGPHGTAGAFEASDHRLGTFLIRRIADAKLAEAAPLLAELAAERGPYSRNKGDAVAALRAIGGPESVRAILATLERVVSEERVPWDASHVTLFVMPMIDAMLAIDDEDPFERLAPFFTEERLASPAGARIANDVLASITGKLGQRAHDVVKLLHPDRAPAVMIGADPRWIDRLVRLLGDRRLRPFAKNALKSVQPMEVQAAFERVAGPKAKPKAPTAPTPAEIDDARPRAEALMRELRATLERAAATLKKAKYSPRAKRKCLSEVDQVVTEGRLAELEKLTKVRLPETVRALYLVVGPIDFQRPLDTETPKGLEAFAASPRFQIVPLDRAIKDVKRRIRENTGIPLSLRDPLALDLAEDAAVRVDAWTFDPRMETTDETLTEYLGRRVAAWGLG